MDNSEIELKTLVGVLRRQLSFIIMTILFCCVIAVIYLVSVTPIYSTSALIMVDPAEKDLLSPDTQANANQGIMNARVESEVEILKSDAIALTVVREESLLNDPEFGPRPGLLEMIALAIGIERNMAQSPEDSVRQTVDRLKDAIHANRRGLTYLIDVSVSSEDPKRAAELTNSLAENYIAQQLTSKIEVTLAARDVLQAQIDASRSELSESESALDDFIRENIERIENETGRMDLSAIVAGLSETSGDRLRTEVMLRQSQSDLRNRNWADLVAGLEDEALTNLERQRAEIQQRLGRVVADSRNEINLRAELEQLEKQLEAESTRRISSIQNRLAELSAEEDASRVQLRDTLLSGQLPPDILAEVFAIQQSAASSRSQYQNLIARLNDVETRAGVQVAHSRIVSPALVPRSPSSPNTKLVIVLALILGSALGVFLAFLKEYFVGGFFSEDQLRSVAQVPMVNSIPLQARMPDNYLSPADAVVLNPLSPFSEAIRRLRASIDQSFTSPIATDDHTQERDGKVILVSSAISGEGKTTTALALARTYAEAGQNVLLIDGDLRRPAIHSSVGVNTDTPFIDLLTDRAGARKLKASSTLDPKSTVTVLLGSGRSSVPTDWLFSSARFKELISRARKSYDIVVIDSPPLLPVVDGRYIAPLVDAVVLLVRWSSTSQSDLRASLGILRPSMKENAALLIALSQRSDQVGRHYTYQYGYGEFDEAESRKPDVAEPEATPVTSGSS